MTQSMIGYDPRASLFKKKNSRGFSFYINYYLPNGVRVRRLCGPTREVSLRRMRIKERELLDGIFEDSDLEKMPLERFEPQRKKRIEIIEGVEIYLEMTRNKRRPRTQQAEQVKLKKNFSHFSGKGLSFLDEISHVEAQRWVNLLEDKGYREATVKSYVTLMSKVFNYFIETSGEIEGRNPFGRVSISRKGTLVRDHLPTDDEVRRILSARLPENSGHTVPIEDIVRFAVFTGARVSEILHAEWGDFDLDEGVRRIRIKPDCPTAEGLGWQPKWGKPREVHLFEEALEVLQRRLRSRPPETEGHVLIREDGGRVVSKEVHPSQFVFYRTYKRGRDTASPVFKRVDNLKKAFSKLTGIAGVEGVMLKDLRTYFNHLLVSRYGFSNKEASSLIGNSPEVNLKHYDPVSLSVIRNKTGGLPISELIGLDQPRFIN
jgi:integrase